MLTTDQCISITNVVCGIYLGLFSSVPGIAADDSKNMSRVYIDSVSESETPEPEVGFIEDQKFRLGFGFGF